jgi:hyaluronan synthase
MNFFRDLLVELRNYKSKYLYIFLLLFLSFYLIYTRFEFLFIERNFNYLNFYGTLIFIFLIIRYFISIGYKPTIWKRKSSYKPKIDIIVPAYNEGEAVYGTVESIIKSNYPLKKLKIYIVNDGSTDDTAAYARKAVREFNKYKNIYFLDLKNNVGKREAMAAGIRKSKSSYILFVDSDSFLDKNCISEMIKPFLVDKEIGAVTGKAEVRNYEKNYLTRMQAVSYHNTFGTIKSLESMMGFITCCSGCCAAYRRSLVMENLETWLNQEIFGVKCTFGDDRALTNLVLKSGYKCVYSSKAIAETIVPEKYKQYFKQQLRWRRSWLNETRVLLTYLHKKNIFSSIFIFFEWVITPLITPFATIIFLAYLVFVMPPGAIATYLIFVGLLALCFGIYFKLGNQDKKNWLLAALLSTIINVFLFWQLPYALVTFRQNGWGTR